jgi:hypothetical protein
MMSAAFAPPGATDVVYALLKVVADPEGTKARLQELAEESAAVKSKIDEMNTLVQQLAADRAAFRQETADTQNNIAALQNAADQRLAEAERRAAVVAAAEVKLGDSEIKQAAIDLQIAEKQKILDQVTAHLDALKARL